MVDRRRFLTIAGASIVSGTVLAGCLSNDGDEVNEDAGDDDGDNEVGTDGEENTSDGGTGGGGETGNESTGGDGEGNTDDQQPDIPPGTFSMRTVEGSIIVTHEGGDSIPADSLSIHVDGQEERDWETDDQAISEGDSVSVAVNPGQTVALVWEAEDGSASEVLLERTRSE